MAATAPPVIVTASTTTPSSGPVLGDIVIGLSKPFYVAGERIDGTAYLDLKSTAPHATLKVRWTGYERTLFHNLYVEESSPMHKVKTDHKMFKHEDTIFHSPTPVTPGKWSWPISFQLPADTPGIFYEERHATGSKVKAAILYKVKVFLDVPGKDLKKTEKICVAPALCKAPKPLHDSKSKSFLLHSGKLHMDYWLDKNVFLPGETIPVRVKVENHSTKKVDHIKIKLMRAIKLKADTPKGVIGPPQLEAKYLDEVQRQVYDGVHAKSDVDTTFNFTLKPDLYPTCDGKYCDCDYHLDIECDIPLCPDLEHHVPVILALMPTASSPIGMFAAHTSHSW
ncbi:triosephosphate isomerase 1 [Pelomyxa schiedti]|nr:triosephosphate isomerase 1 [Pelomyxa schiedti]